VMMLDMCGLGYVRIMMICADRETRAD
jgi:hypothetical protein